jgi:hypothetical protein
VARAGSLSRTLPADSPASDAVARAFLFLRTLGDVTPSASGLGVALGRSQALADAAPMVDVLTRLAASGRALADAAIVAESVNHSLSGATIQFVSTSGTGTIASVTFPAAPTTGNFMCIGYHFGGVGAPVAPTGWERSRLAQAATGPTSCFYYRRVGAGESATFSLTNSSSSAWGLHAWELTGVATTLPFEADAIASSDAAVASLASGPLTTAGSSHLLAVLGTSGAFGGGSVAFSGLLAQAEAPSLRSASGRGPNSPPGQYSTTASWTNGRKAALTFIALKTSSAYEVALTDAAVASDVVLDRSTMAARAVGDLAALLAELQRATAPSRVLPASAPLSDTVNARRERSRSLADSVPANASVAWLAGALRDLIASAPAYADLARETGSPRSLIDSAAAMAELAQYVMVQRALPDAAGAVGVLSFAELVRLRALEETAGAVASLFGAFAQMEASVVLPALVEVLASWTEADPEPSASLVEVVLSRLEASIYH